MMSSAFVTCATVVLAHNEMEYFTFGKGKTPMVILPGMSLKSIMNSAAGVASAYRAFAEDFTVYCFDRTKFLTENYTIGQFAEDTAEAMRILGIKNACVFGASQGGMIAMYLAIDHPGLVKKLLLGSTCARPNPTSEAIITKWISLAEQGDTEGLCDCFVDVLYGRAFAEKFGDFIKLIHRDTTMEELSRFAMIGKACDDLDIYDRLDEIRCPVLVIGAENDRVLTAQASVEIAEKLGCGCYLYGSEYGHSVFDEAPDYKDRIIDFFKE